jgi:phosphoesterase RecJ-like protein
VGKHLRLRVLPELRFFPDDSLDRVYELEEVFREIHEDQEAQPMLAVSFAELVDTLRQGERFVITSHVSPDGDAVGSMLAARALLQALGKKQVTCVLSDPVPAMYRTLPGAKDVLVAGEVEEVPEFDTLLILDVASYARIGDVAAWRQDSHNVLIVDHHLVDDPVGNQGVVDSSYAAVGEMIVELFLAAEVPLTPEAAHCAYVAQVTDTGGYRYANTNARSHEIGALLHQTGIDTASICSEVFDRIPRPRISLLGTALDRMTFVAEGAIAYTYMTAADLEAAGGNREHLEGFVNYARNVDGVCLGIIFTELEPGKTKVSVRAREGFNAAAFLHQFGGGGHAAAAGATLDASVEDAVKMIVSAAESALETSE